MTMQELRLFNTDRGDIEDLVALFSFATMIEHSYEELDMEPPEWLTNKRKAIKRELMHRQADAIEKRLAEARLRMEGLKTTAEKKAELAREISKLEKLREVSA